MIQPAVRARRFQHQQDQRDAEDLVPDIGVDRAFEEGVSAREHVTDGDERCQCRDPVPPADPITKALCDRIQQKAEEQNERDMDAPQDVRWHDPVGRIQVEQRHHHRNRGDECSQCAAEPVKRPFFLLDVLLGLLQRLRGNGGVHVRRSDSVPHVPERGRCGRALLF
jgi:hypothetical protein